MNIHRNRLFHWTTSFNKNFDSLNPDIASDPNTNPITNPNTNPITNSYKNNNLNINNSPSKLSSNLSSNSNINSNSNSINTNTPSITKIKSEGSTQKQKIISAFKKVTVPSVELSQINFLNILFLNLQVSLQVRSVNIILCQYTSYEQGIYYMLGKQVGVVVQDSHDLNHYRNLFEHYRETLELLMDRYQLDTPDFITFHFKTLHINEDLIAMTKNLNIELHKGLVRVEKLKQNLKSKVLPYSYKEKYLGYLLIDKLRYRYLSDLVALLEKNQIIVTTRKKYPVSFPIEFKKEIVKFTKPLDSESITKSITVDISNFISKYTRHFNSYNVTRCFSAYVKDKKDFKNTIPFYKYNLYRDLLILKDRQRFYIVEANANKNNKINTKYWNILWLIGIVLSISAPSLIYTLTGVNIYDQYYISESIYSKSFINIRLTCATVFLCSIISLGLANVDRLKLSIFKKPILWAPFIGPGIQQVGFEKCEDTELKVEHVSTKELKEEHETTKPMYKLNKRFGDPEMREEDVSTKPMYMLNKNKWAELNENEISVSSKLSAKDNKTLNTSSNSEPQGVNIPYPPGCKNNYYSRPYYGPYWSTEKSVIISSPDSPDSSTGSSIESAYEDEDKKKVRFNNKKKGFYIK